MVQLYSKELSSSKRKMTLNHQCPKCPKRFCSPSKLQRHFLVHTGQKPYSCAICLKAFRQKVHLKSHLNTANKCSLSLSTERKGQSLCTDSHTSVLHPHSSIQQPTSHHTPGNLSVELELQCKIRLNAVQDLKTEIKSNADLKPDEQVSTSNLCRTVHPVTNKDLKPFQCKFCDRSFRLEVNLARHYEIHRKEENVRSPNSARNTIHGECSASEATGDAREPSHADIAELNVVVKPEHWSENDGSWAPQELITSAGQRRDSCQTAIGQQRSNSLHQCYTCLKCFPSVSKLQRHMMTHTGERPFGCEMCGKTFRQKTHLRVHCRTHLWFRYRKPNSLYINRLPSRMGGYRRTSADFPSQETMPCEKQLERHTCTDGLAVKHSDQTSSIDIVQNIGRSDSEIKSLPRTSNNNNEVLLVKKASTATVRRKHGAGAKHNPLDAQHKCFRCSKCFQSASKLQRHEMVHTGLKPFKCPTCGKAFRQASHLKVHEGLHCKKKPSKSIDRQKMNTRQPPYPKITVCVPPQKKFVNIEMAGSLYDGTVSNGERRLPCRNGETSLTKEKRLKSNAAANARNGRKVHMCRICSKNFLSPYKLSRHLVTHSGIRPYKCGLCSKTFTQRGHLNAHEHRCRQTTSVCTVAEVIRTAHTQDTRLETLSDCTDFHVDAAREKQQPHYTSTGHCSFSDVALSYCSEAIDSKWLVVPELCLQEVNNEPGRKQRENVSQATDHDSFSFPSELAFEINKLVQNQKATLPFSHVYDHNAQNAETARQHSEVIIDGNKLLSNAADHVVEHLIHTDWPDDYWCEPLVMFECDVCAEMFRSANGLEQHICAVEGQPKISYTGEKNRCDRCFKTFVSPSKLKRHYFIHTGQRPFECDVCGKTFTQASHVTTHRLTHS